MQKLPVAAAIAVVFAASATAQAAEWTVNTDSSSVGFAAEQQGSRFNGRFQTFSATIDFDPADPASGSVVGSVVTDSVNTRDHDRDAALTDRDWFDSANHPEASFESESITALDDGSYEAAGNMTLKGTTKPMTMTFTFETGDAGATFAGTMSIDRFDFGVGDGWNDTSWVGQIVDVEIELALSQ